MADNNEPELQPQTHQHHHHHSHPRRRLHIWRWVGGIVLALIVAAAGFAWYTYKTVKDTANNTYIPLSKANKDAQAAISKQKPISLLLMGTDTGALGRTEARGRTDTMIVVTVNPQTKTTTMVSVPRDTMSQMIGYDGVNIQKINAAYNIGGSDMAVNTVSALLNLPIQHYALVNMGGMEKVVDAVGGVDVDVPFDFDNAGYAFKKGAMHLDGKKALAYVRMRYDDPKGDYGRTARQRQVITGILKAAPSFKSLTNFKTLLTQVENNFRSSMTFDDMLNLFQHYRSAANTVKEDSLQGVGCYLNGSAYQIMATKELQRVSDTLRASMGLKKATLSNEETKQNALNPNFDWTAANTKGYVVQGADRVN
ncbi:LCP family protein [Lacticaseibacillus parakribbianus]|uniref:LCP family glycopolymer transferase n=1 Tax=Lacticaseibacillus parakribbianus TaxID=2970927 RepID=UPI0021CB696F|nr:LCP family protein [Lacticaseibacillus parakribbianus]